MGLVNKSDYIYAKLQDKALQINDELIELDDKEIIRLGLKSQDVLTVNIDHIEWTNTEPLETYEGTKANLPKINIYWDDETVTEASINYTMVDNVSYYLEAGNYELRAIYRDFTSTNALPITVIKKELISIEWENTNPITTQQNHKAYLPYIKLNYNDGKYKRLSSQSPGITLSDSKYYLELGEKTLIATYKEFTTNELTINVVEEEIIDELTSDMVFEIYENIYNDLILDIKIPSLVSCELEGIDKTNNSNWVNKLISLEYGPNIITSFVKYSSIYQYSYEEKNSLVLKVNYNNKEYQFDVVFELQNDKSFYECKIIQNPKFIFNIKTYDNFEIRLIDPLIISQKNIKKTINDISDYNFYIINNINYEPYKSNDLLNEIGDINDNCLKFTYNFAINKTYAKNSSYIYQGGYLLKIEYNQDCVTWQNDIFNSTTLLTTAFYWTSDYQFHITDYYNLGKYYGYELINNFESNNVNKIEEINYYINYTYNYSDELNNIFKNDQDFIDLLCQKLNCQQIALQIYNNCEYEYFNGPDKRMVGGIDNSVFEYNKLNLLVNIYKNIDLISGNSINFLSYTGQGGSTTQKYKCNYNKFKLFVTANNIDYILINCGWDIIDKDKNHYLIDPITNEHISINE